MGEGLSDQLPGRARAGWWLFVVGLFLLPMIFILLLQAVRIVLPNLVRGEELTPAVELGGSVGTDPSAGRNRDEDGEEAVDSDSSGG
ncbi:hypothetical protein ACKVMT_15900 [Halobacteriales archaeon Cl-PHB]